MALHSILNFGIGLFQISDQRREQIYREVETGSDPRFNYYLLLLLSSLIAAFGLIANSPTVVIGAMLVSPLMMPIFGISLGLITGDTTLLRAALIAEVGGVLLVVGSSFLVGLSPFSFEMTQEILGRTSPNLLDLFVAALAGFAGCMAMIDERISPILPGIAISTSLTPPLSACGLCLAFQAFEGSMGAFILFFANFLTILFVASLTFIVSGFIQGRFGDHKVVFAKRFSLAMISMIVIIFFLTDALIRLVEKKTTTSHVRQATLAELSKSHNVEIKEITIDKKRNQDEFNVLVVIDSPNTPSSFQVKAIEKTLKQVTGKNINLFIKTRIIQSVSSSPEKLIQFFRTANGIEEYQQPGNKVRILSIASQIIRERIEQIPDMLVTGIELRHTKDGKTIIYTTVQGPVRPFPDGIRKIERTIQKALEDTSVRLVAKYVQTYEVASEVGLDISPAENSVPVDESMKRIQQLAKERIDKLPSLSTLAVKARLIDGGRWIVIAEVNGPLVMTNSQAEKIQEELMKETGKEIIFKAFSKAEVLVSGKDSPQRKI